MKLINFLKLLGFKTKFKPTSEIKVVDPILDQANELINELSRFYIRKRVSA